jgi:hypothetical protein
VLRFLSTRVPVRKRARAVASGPAPEPPSEPPTAVLEEVG